MNKGTRGRCGVVLCFVRNSILRGGGGGGCGLNAETGDSLGEVTYYSGGGGCDLGMQPSAGVGCCGSSYVAL